MPALPRDGGLCVGAAGAVSGVEGLDECVDEASELSERSPGEGSAVTVLIVRTGEGRCADAP